MSKKDYIVLAGVLSQYNKAMQAIDYKITGRAMMSELTITLTHALKADNPRFDVERFLIACGINK